MIPSRSHRNNDRRSHSQRQEEIRMEETLVIANKQISEKPDGNSSGGGSRLKSTFVSAFLTVALSTLFRLH